MTMFRGLGLQQMIRLGLGARIAIVLAKIVYQLGLTNLPITGGGQVIPTRQSDKTLALTQLDSGEAAYPGLFRATTVADGATSLGSEKWTGTGVIFGAGWSDLGGGLYACDGSNTSASLLKSAPWIIAFNKVYISYLTIVSRSAGQVRCRLGGTIPPYISGVGVHIVELSTSSGTGDILVDADIGFIGTVRISVKKVIPNFLDTLPDTTPCHPMTGSTYDVYPEWEADTVYAAGAKIEIGGFWYSTVAGGTSDSSAHADFYVIDTGVTDNTVTWVYGGLYASGCGGVLLEEGRTNYFINPEAPVTQDITTTAQDYTVSVEGSGSVTLSGTATGVATEDSPLTVTATAGALTCTCAGTLTFVNVQAGSFPTSFIAGVAAPVTRPATLASKASTGILRANNLGIDFWAISEGTQDARVLWSSYTDASNYLHISTNAGDIEFTKCVAGTPSTVAVTFAPTAGTPFRVQAYQSEAGMAVDASEIGSAWIGWDALTTDAGKADAVIDDTWEVGSRDGAVRYSGTYANLQLMWSADPVTALEGNR